MTTSAAFTSLSRICSSNGKLGNMQKKRMRAGLETKARKRKNAAPILSRALSRVNVSVEEGSAKDPATARDYRGMLPDVLAILNENTRLRGEVVR